MARRVVATASARDAALVRSLSADHVIDHHATRFEDNLRDIDVVLDTIGGETQERSWRVLRKGGVLVTRVSPIPAGVAEQHGTRGVFFIVSGNRKQLDQITRLVDTGKLKPVLFEVLPLARTREAFEHGAASHAPGKSCFRWLHSRAAPFYARASSLGIMCPSARPIDCAMRAARMDPQSTVFPAQPCRP